MTIQFITGTHKMTGIERITGERVSYADSHKDCEVCRMVLDDTVIEIVENPDDGYRSYAEGPHEVDTPVHNTFAPISVVCTHLTDNEQDVLRIINIETGAVILDVGTDNLCDYYPSWICNFSAEGLGEINPQ